MLTCDGSNWLPESHQRSDANPLHTQIVFDGGVCPLCQAQYERNVLINAVESVANGLINFQAGVTRIQHGGIHLRVPPRED